MHSDVSLQIAQFFAGLNSSSTGQWRAHLGQNYYEVKLHFLYLEVPKTHIDKGTKKSPGTESGDHENYR